MNTNLMSINVEELDVNVEELREIEIQLILAVGRGVEYARVGIDFYEDWSTISGITLMSEEEEESYRHSGGGWDYHPTSEVLQRVQNVRTRAWLVGCLTMLETCRDGQYVILEGTNSVPSIVPADHQPRQFQRPFHPEWYNILQLNTYDLCIGCTKECARCAHYEDKQRVEKGLFDTFTRCKNCTFGEEVCSLEVSTPSERARWNGLCGYQK